MKCLILIFGILMVLGSLFSCSETPTTTCDTCDTSHHCDTCDTTHTGPNDTTSHNFTWTEYKIPGEINLTGVWVFSDTNIYLLGTYLYQFNGTNWTKIDVREENTSRELAFPDWSLFAFSPADYWVVHGIIDHGHGTKATEYRLTDAEMQGALCCWGSSSTDMFFVGLGGKIFHFDGTNFEKMASPTTKDLRDVWGTSHNDVWACGFNSSTAETTLIHYDGVSWTEDNISQTKGIYATGGFNGVWACDSASHKFVTTSGALLIRKTDNNSWRSDSGMIPNSLGGGDWVGIAPRGNTANDIFVTGGWGFVAHWNGRSWHKYEELYNYNDASYGPAGFHVKGNTACVVGRKNGTSWIAVGRRTK